MVLHNIHAKIPIRHLPWWLDRWLRQIFVLQNTAWRGSFHQGQVTLRTGASRIGFCGQTAFVLNGTIKENIIGFSPLHQDKYAEAVDATAFSFDLDNLPESHETNVGSDGISLSGGRKQRIALARALYLQTHFLILDHVFSGLDAGTEEQVFHNVFGPAGLLKRRQTIVLLCTHNVRHLQAADYIIALENGHLSDQGTFDQLLAGEGYVRRLELKGSGSSSPTDSEKSGNERSGQEVLTPAKRIKATKLAIDSNNGASRQVGDSTVYKEYVKSMGWALAASAIFSSLLWGFFLNFSSIWLTYWVNDIQLRNPTHSSVYWAGIYGLFQVCALIALFLLGASIWVISIKPSGPNLHEGILKTLFQAPLRFFTEIDTGVTTNLFSQDLNLIDTALPDSNVSTLFSISQCLEATIQVKT
ncbi:hypothetical protein MCOR25_004877 [Pyricularia grisea]|nr:hypothetical protein MCOR25_004877 [Pyricularia grisea]